MKCNINDTPLRIRSIPRKMNGIHNYQNATNRHFSDGWRDVVNPVYDASIERLGDLVINGNEVTYEVIPLTEQEIETKKRNELNNQKKATIQAKLSKSVIEEAQALTDDKEILANNILYEFWEVFENGYTFSLDLKLNRLINDEVRTFKVIQSHNKQSDWQPENFPSLFSEIVMSGGIEVWSQPIGGDGKYPNPYQVIHNGKTWNNTVDAPTLNVWEPGVFGWEEVV